MTRKNKKKLAQKIKIYMLQKGISQRVLAQKLKVTPSAISGFLNGNNALRTDTLDKIAKALDTDASFFFDNSPDVIGVQDIAASSLRENKELDLQKEIQFIKKELEVHRLKLENIELKLKKGNK